MKILFTILLTTALTISADAAGKLKPMNVVEKSSYLLNSLVSKKQIDASYLNNITALTIVTTDTGYSVEMSAPTDATDVFNTLSMSFDKKGAPTGQSTKFVSAPSKPVFTTVDSSKIIDLAAEAVVDHLSESADLVTVADNVKVIHYSVSGAEILVSVTLTDARVFNIQMDLNAVVLSKIF